VKLSVEHRIENRMLMGSAASTRAKAKAKAAAAAGSSNQSKSGSSDVISGMSGAAASAGGDVGGPVATDGGPTGCVERDDSPKDSSSSASTTGEPASSRQDAANDGTNVHCELLQVGGVALWLAEFVA